MQGKKKFLTELEKYTWKRVGRVAYLMPYVVIFGSCLAIISSIFEAKNSVSSVNNWDDVIIVASLRGDYQAAQKYYKIREDVSDLQVLGAESELEELVYPELKVEIEIRKYEDLLSLYPDSFDIYIHLAKLYQEIGKKDEVTKYLDMARVLDPNNQIINQFSN